MAEIDTDFPGGSVKVVSLKGDAVHLTPDLRDTEGFWFYWCFRVRGAEGRTLRFEFEGGPCLGRMGPMIRRGMQGKWEWLGQEDPEVESFSYNFQEQDREVYFSFCAPYTDVEWVHFLESECVKRKMELQFGLLTHSRKGREVPFLRIPSVGDVRTLVVATARHHACESSANYVMEGMVSAWKPVPEVELLAVPFMDMDGVCEGDQGKNRRPHDHNRDYGEEPIYPEVRALQERIRSAEVDRMYCFDLHCPWIKGARNELLYQVRSSHSEIDARQAEFGNLLESLAEGLPYRVENDLAFGEEWNVPKNYSQGISCSGWMTLQKGCSFAGTLEIPYAWSQGVAVTPESARAFGKSFARAIQQFVGE